MKKLQVPLRLAIMTLILSIIVSGCGSPTKSASPGSKTKPAKTYKPIRPANRPAKQNATQRKQEQETEPWKQVATFTGTGMQETPEFTITSNVWRVTISGTSPDPAAQASFAGYVHAKGDDPESPNDQGQIKGEGQGPVSSDLYSSGTYFIHMHSENLEWTVKVEELRL